MNEELKDAYDKMVETYDDYHRSINRFFITVMVLLALFLIVLGYAFINAELNQKNFCESEGLQPNKYDQNSCVDFKNGKAIIKPFRKYDGEYYFIEGGKT